MGCDGCVFCGQTSRLLLASRECVEVSIRGGLRCRNLGAGAHNFLVLRRRTPHFALSRGAGQTLNATYLTSLPSLFLFLSNFTTQLHHVDITDTGLCGRYIGLWFPDLGDRYVALQIRLRDMVDVELGQRLTRECSFWSLLPLRARGRAHRFCQEASVPADIRRRRPTSPAPGRRWLSNRPQRVERRVAHRICAELKEIPNC